MNEAYEQAKAKFRTACLKRKWDDALTFLQAMENACTCDEALPWIMDRRYEVMQRIKWEKARVHLTEAPKIALI